MSLTIVYYTANRVSEKFAERVRRFLFWNSNGLPIISVSQKPIDFGENICIGGIGATPYNLYRQVLAGTRQAQTKFVALCEDDTLYPRQHFARLPSGDELFHYNTNRWWLEPKTFRWRINLSTCACIAPQDLLIDTLERRFEKYPEEPDRENRWSWRHFGEPGRERRLGLPVVPVARYQTPNAIVTVNHRDSLGGRRKTSGADTYADELPLWGKASDLWGYLYADE